MTAPRRASTDSSIRVGVVGAGAMGTGLAYQCSVTEGMECVALADLVPARAAAAGALSGRPVRHVASAGELHDAILAGSCAACEDGALLATCDAIDVLLEASSAVVEAAELVLAALEARKPVALMNAEADLTFGPLFLDTAERNGVVVTSIDGDQHGAIKRLADQVASWGFDLTLAGNIKGFLDHDADPTSIVPEADKRNLDHRMCVGYTDGTKLGVEMALLANALGLRVDVPGMHGPCARHAREALAVFDLDALRAGGQGVVDYILGAEPGGGVFVVGHCDHPYQRQMMDYYKMGPGPFYVFYRPYHLCHVEALASVAAAFRGEELLAPRAGFRANVYACAKRDLETGEVLDGVGGYTCRGVIDNCRPSWVEEPLPICLCDGLRLRHSVRRGEMIRPGDVAYGLTHPGLGLYERARAAGAWSCS